MLDERPNELYIRSNPAATWSLVLGLTGLFLSAVVVGGLVGVAAVVVGIKAVRGPSRRSLALGGILSGAAAIPLAIIALIFWTGIFQTRAAFQAGAENTVADATLVNVRTALDAFEVDNGRYPTTEEGLNALLEAPPDLPHWRGPYLEKVPTNRAGQALEYRSPGDVNPNGYDLHFPSTDARDDEDEPQKQDTEY